MSAFRKLVRELHRRSIWQVLGIYIVGSWAAYQVVVSLMEGLGLPAWVPPMAVVLFVIGLPIVLATAFVQEGLPGGDQSEDADGELATSSAAAAAGGHDVEAAARPDAAGSSGADVQPDADSPSGTDGQDGVSAGPKSVPRLFTWKGAVTGGVLAFAVLGLATTGFMAMRNLGIGPVGSLVGKGELEPSDHVLVAEFNPLTGDSAIAAVVAEAVRVDLSQSDLLNVVDRRRIDDALDRMGRQGDVRLAGDLAREVAYRTGVKAVVEGEVGGAAGSYLISAKLVTPDSGRTLASFRETAEDSTDLLPAVDRLTRKLREKAGESLRSIRANPPLTQVTTASLPALRKYVRAKELLNANRTREAMTLLTEAIALDPGFATAHRSLAVLMWNRGRRGDSLFHHLEEAVRLESRLTDYERHHARGFRAVATWNPGEARREFETLLAMDSTDAVALINLGVLYGSIGDHERELELFRQAYDTGLRGPVVYWNLVQSYLELGQYDRAEEVIRLEAEEAGRPGRAAYMQWLVEMARSDFAAADSITTVIADEYGNESFARNLDSRLALLQGRLADAGVDNPPTPPNDLGRLFADAFQGYLDLFVRQDPESAGDRAERALEIASRDTAAVASLPVPAVAIVLALAGRPDAARRAVRMFRERVRPELIRQHDAMLDFAGGIADVTAGDVESGLQRIERARDRVACGTCGGSLAGYAYEVAGRPDSAIAAYEGYLDEPWADRHNFGFERPPSDALVRVFVHERLAALHEDRGSRSQARRHLRAIVDLWGDADPELQPRVRDARSRLQRLTEETGS